MPTRRLDQLKPHPFSLKIYGEDDPVDDLVERFRKRIERGEPPLTRPVAITADDTIVGGHRRARAAKIVDLDEVEVVVMEFKDELEEQEYILDDNETRTKTPYQVGQEMAARLENEQKRTKHLQQEGGAKGGKQSGATRRGETKPGDTSRQASREPRASDKVGEKFGVSGRTVEKTTQVVNQIDRLNAEGKTQESEHLKGLLNQNERSVDPAYKEMKRMTAKADDQHDELPTDDKRVRKRLCRKVITQIDKVHATLVEIARHPIGEEICLRLHAGDEGFNLSRLDADLVSFRKVCEAIGTVSAQPSTATSMR